MNFDNYDFVNSENFTGKIIITSLNSNLITQQHLANFKVNDYRYQFILFLKILKRIQYL